MGRHAQPHSAGKLAKSDEVLLETPLGRENDYGAPDRGVITEDEIRKDVSARPRSEVTGRHDEGSDANETVDGLDEMGETVRRYAEDLPTKHDVDSLTELPVFDRPASLPKI
jgi:hypothetical protein